MENEVFCTGVAVGIQIHQDRVVEAIKEESHLSLVIHFITFRMDGRGWRK